MQLLVYIYLYCVSGRGVCSLLLHGHISSNVPIVKVKCCNVVTASFHVHLGSTYVACDWEGEAKECYDEDLAKVK